MFGQQYLMLDYDCPRTRAGRGHGGHAGPGVTDHRAAGRPGLGRGARAGARRDVNAIMDELAAIGAKAILASDIRFCRF